MASQAAQWLEQNASTRVFYRVLNMRQPQSVQYRQAEQLLDPEIFKGLLDEGYLEAEEITERYVLSVAGIRIFHHRMRRDRIAQLKAELEMLEKLEGEEGESR